MLVLIFIVLSFTNKGMPLKDIFDCAGCDDLQSIATI